VSSFLTAHQHIKGCFTANEESKEESTQRSDETAFGTAPSFAGRKHPIESTARATINAFSFIVVSTAMKELFRLQITHTI